MTELRVLLATTVVPDDRKTLACARALAASGIWVAVAGDGYAGEAYWSRSVRQRLRYPHPAVDPDAFLSALNAHLVRHRIDVVLPMNDALTEVLSRMKDRLVRTVRTAFPGPEPLEIAADKTKTVALAEELGIAIPRTFVPESEDDLERIAGEIGYPCVCKRRRGSGAIGLTYPTNRTELLEACRPCVGSIDARAVLNRVLIQEYVPGETHDVCAIAAHSECRVSLTQRRRWMHPRRGGVGVSVESTDEPFLREQAHRMLAALAWHGPACVEFRVDTKGGRAWFIEINGRLGGASAAGIHAGVNYPLLLTRLALDGDIAPLNSYRVGRRFRWPLPFAILALREGRPREVFREFLAPIDGAGCDLQWLDPLPHLAEIAFAVRRLSGVRGKGWLGSHEEA